MTANPQSRLAFSVLSSLVRDLLQRTRDLQNSLHPIVLESLGLETALESLANQLQRTTGLNLNTDLARLEQRLPTRLEIQLLRAVETACQVAITHYAQAIDLILRHSETAVYIFISDDGDGRPIEEYALAIPNLHVEFGPDRHGYHQLKITAHRMTEVDLTPRETEILYWVAQGLTNKQIAAQVAISPRTVKYHLDNIFTKMDASSRTEAAMKALQLGLLDEYRE
jgi:DNA-binding NarL/FixJ family response regulator